MSQFPSIKSVVLRNKEIRNTKSAIREIYPRVARGSSTPEDEKRFVQMSKYLDMLYANKVRAMQVRNLAVLLVSASVFM